MGDTLFVHDGSPSAASCGSSTGSNSSSTGEEERLQRLFNSCDGDGDGFLDSGDFIYMCRQLNMEDMAGEIMHQLGLQSQSKITFQDFLRFRGQVQNEEVDLSLGVEDLGIDSDLSGALRNPDNVTSWPTMSSDSFGACSGKPDSLDYDSGARDMSPEPASLHQLVESHNPQLLSLAQDDSLGLEILDVTNRLHLAALTSLKGEIIELNNRLHHVTSERDILEKQVNRLQADKLRLQQECEKRLEITAGRYEERITELHSVIAELRKKIERHQINVIREEDEYEDAAVQSNKSNDGGSRAANESQANSLDILGNELNTEISRVVTTLDDVIEVQPMKTPQETAEEGCNTEEALCDIDDSVEELAIQACKQIDAIDLEPPPSPPPRGLRPATFHPPPPPPPNEYPDPGYLQEVIFSLRQDAMVLQETVQRQEAELNMHRAAIGSLREERDKLRQRVHEMRTEQVSPQHLKTSPQGSRTSTPTKNYPPHTPTDRSQLSNQETFPVAKVAELKKLKTCSNERPVLGCELESGGLPNTKVAEHLVQNMQKGSNMQEIVQNLYSEGGQLTECKVQEFEIEFERLQSKIDSLKSQNDLLGLTLEESKSQSDRLSVLIGKYESNNTALQLGLNYSDQIIEAYDVVLSLTESELGLTLSNCRAAGLTQGLRNSPLSPDELNQLAQKSRNTRKTAENVARHLIQKLDRNFGVNPWEETSTHTASTSSSGCYSEDFSKAEEQKLREYIHQLKAERASIKSTVMELESLHADTAAITAETPRHAEACRLDLENAVLMQELMAMKEEKAELRAQNYLLEKEKNALELRLSGKESREQAYVIQIEHLKSEVEERSRLQEAEHQTSETSPLDDRKSHDLPEGSSQELYEALQRERKLKSRVQELVIALEKLSRNSEIRHQQSAEFVSDLKKANSALIAAFEKTKKKYQGKLKKLEFQIQALTERYEAQIHMLKQRLLVVENAGCIPPNETSL
uniref:Colorectal mutant cancer protein-like isoform X1 n=1 Tax=Crassostrea virginica TaxID=6565 RepID=A0A8B8C7V2_CRAVI|nr:colorectal mutant cancer protein-like isoform X1 [Crassostrea virginica]